MKNLSYFIVFSVMFFSACQRQEVARQYSEVITQPAPVTTQTGSDTPDPHAGLNIAKSQKDPHAFMKDMGETSDPHAGFSKEQLQEMLGQAMPGQTSMANKENSPIAWTVPPNWQEKSATGMRLATFVNKSSVDAIDCSIVTLGAAAGGLEPNVIRWLQQLKVEQPSAEELQKFIEKQDRTSLANGLTAITFDFTALQKDAPGTAASMIATIIDTPQQRIFVKMTGNKQKVSDNLKNFKSLVQSIKVNM